MQRDTCAVLGASLGVLRQGAQPAADVEGADDQEDPMARMRLAKVGAGLGHGVVPEGLGPEEAGPHAPRP